MYYCGVGSKMANKALVLLRLHLRPFVVTTGEGVNASSPLNVMRQLQTLKEIVAEQAEDEGLWGVPLPPQKQMISEAHLQPELRKLHSAVEAID